MAAAKVFPQKLVIASRASRLALWQAEHVCRLLKSLYPETEVEIDAMTTRGDQILDRALNKIGGKGLFIKELEQALLLGRCDLAVHSLKDVPMMLEPEFELVAMLEREDARDAFVSGCAQDLASLPSDAVVGTSSLRREVQIRSLRPDLRIEPLRGNLDTRLMKLDRGDYHAIILAAAGLKRLGLSNRIKSLLPVESSLPAPGQGVLGIEILANREELRLMLEPLNHAASSSAARSERQVSRVLGGSCEVPLAAYAEKVNDRIICRGLIASPDGRNILTASSEGDWRDPEAIGNAVAGELLALGAGSLMPPQAHISHTPD